MTDLNRRDFALGTAATGLALASGAAGAAVGNDRAAIHKEIERQHDAPTAGATAHLPGCYVNDFGAVGDGRSHPLSERYETLGAAQVVYPHATSLTDEIDWCAWQGASNYIFQRDVGRSPSGYNVSSGYIVADGNYVVNRTVDFNHQSIRIEGPVRSMNGMGRCTTIAYGGPDGTIDNPIPIFYFHITGNASSGGVTAVLRNLWFAGPGSTPGTLGFSKFISGIRLDASVFTHISDCQFGGNFLYDGIYVTEPQLFLTIERCYFVAIERDAIAIWPYRGNFSTTVWINNNEFANCGRYAMYLDFYGSVEAMPIIRDNSLEQIQSLTNFYTTRPEWWVQGVVASCCVVGGGNMIWENNRDEGGTGGLDQYYWSTIHVLGGIAATVTKGTTGLGIFVSGLRGSVERTSQGRAMWGAASAWQASHAYSSALSGDPYVKGVAYYHQCTTSGTSGGTQPVWPTTPGATVNDGSCVWTCKALIKSYHDITDARNYNMAMQTDYANGSFPQGLAFTSHYGNPVIFCGDGLGGDISVGGMATSFGAVPTMAGTYARICQPRKTAKPSLMSIPLNAGLAGAYVKSTNGAATFHTWSRQCGSYQIAAFGTGWQANHDYVATWYFNGPDIVTGVPENGLLFRCTTAGRSGRTQPTWIASIGATVNDGTCVWTCIGNTWLSGEVNQEEWVHDGLRNRMGYGPPTAGLWRKGDKVWAVDVSAGGYIGWVCINTGVPGPWKGFGAIAL